MANATTIEIKGVGPIVSVGSIFIGQQTLWRDSYGRLEKDRKERRQEKEEAKAHREDEQPALFRF